ncbi:MAG: phenylalanine--tRNA ligase subunit beta [Candidatus Nanopelagicales bacterium]|nr:phenylalanine--tRNA ligase subunit beta [Candidatus Nanopelagicales bacterium]
MRIAASWLTELTGVEASGRDMAERLIAAGLEVESVESIGEGLTGDLLVGRVEAIEELTEFKKPIRYCQVDVGADHGGVRGIICGARNFAAGDLVVVAVPGTILPGGFEISARETYGKVSNGMICSEREMGLGEDHDGILVLPPAIADPGANAKPILGIGDQVLDIAVTPDRGYALSARGVAREIAIAFGVPFHDPVDRSAHLPAPSQTRIPAECASDDLEACDLFTLSTVVNFDPHARTPQWMKNRLRDCGMRSVSLAVDITNYVMLELGQPLHAFDLDRLQGTVRAGHPREGEKFETLDHVERTLSASDLVILDDRGTIGLAGVMGGLDAEISDTSTNIALEAAHFDSTAIAQSSRKYKLSSEASRRFERGVDRTIAPYAAARALELMLEFGGGEYVGMNAVEAPMDPTAITIDADLPSRIAGMDIPADRVLELLTAVGCQVTSDAGVLEVVVPSWRPDLTDQADLVEEVVRLIGYSHLPSTLPVAPAGRGLTHAQKLRRRVGTALAHAGLAEVLSYPFVGPEDLTALRLPAEDARRDMPTLANPLSDEQPWLRSAVLFTLLPSARRNVGRGHGSVPIFEIGTVFQGSVSDAAIPRLSVEAPPSPEQWRSLEAALPSQPIHIAAVLAGDSQQSGWWGSARPFDWSDSIDMARTVASTCGLTLSVTRGTDPLFHPGRCAELSVTDADGTCHAVGTAGELHPAVCESFGLPERTCAMEMDLSLVIECAPSVMAAPVFSTQPVAKEDLAVVVDHSVDASVVEQALRDGAGELLESIRLFDVYSGPQVGEGKKSLAFALRFRSPDHTLSAEETTQARESALSRATEVCGAVLR